MKRNLLVAMAFCSILFSKQGLSQDPGLYKATYSSDFKVGKSANALKVLDIWKDWDDNQIDRHDYFSDTIVMMFADGSSMKGKKENLEAAKKYRSGLKKVVSSIHAWLPLTSVDRNEDLVCIWGQETNTLANGEQEIRDLHEVWWFNKDGKVTMVRQWTAKFGN
ncbi:MAG: hypothetical protein EOO03_02685 [Chitinophagaceae bacterium]|nr:MAG: hypothetical protein EOO03_02685 [Chitinophagaceae bacterium]